MINKFNYFSPEDFGEALILLTSKKGPVFVIAGGTDLIPRMRAHQVEPISLIDLKNLSLDRISSDASSIHIGACVTLTQIIESEMINDYLPALVSACKTMAGPPVRNRATIGGNLATASPAADTAPPLLIYDAVVVVRGMEGQRLIPVNDFFVGPGKTGLSTGEIITEIVIPKPPTISGCSFIKFGKREAMAIAVVSVAVRLSLDSEGRIDQSRIALGSVAPTPIRAINAENLLNGQMINDDLMQDAGLEAGQATLPITDIRASAEYRRSITEVLVRRAIRASWRTLNGIKTHA